MIASWLLTATAWATAPLQQDTGALEARVAAEPELAQRDFWRSDRDGDGGSPLLWIERPAGDPTAAAAMVEATRAFYGPWLAEVDRAFREALAGPAGLARAPDALAPAVVILASRPAYALCGGDPERTGAHLDPELGALLGWSQAGSSGPAATRRGALLRPYARSLLESWAPGPLPRAPCWLIDRGVEDWLVGPDLLEPSRPEERAPPIGLLFELTSSLRMSRDARFVPRLEEMLRATDPRAMAAVVRARAPEVPYGLEELAARLDSGAVGALPALWMHFLWSADQGAHRASLLKLFGLVQRGHRPLESFRQAFDERPLPELERAFFGWVSDSYVARANGGTPLGPAHLAFLDFPVPPPPGELAAMEPGVLLPADPASLTPLRGAADRPLAVGEIALAHELALDRARRGDLRAALSLAERALAAAESEPEAADPESTARLRRELGRLGALATLREDYLAHLAGTGGKLRLEDAEGKRRALTVEAVGEGRVRFAANRHGFEELALDELPSMQLAAELDDFVEGTEREWLRFYPYVLEGDARWKRLLRPANEAGRELERDADDWLAEAALRGRAAGALEALAAGGRPPTRAEAQRTLDAITALVAEHGELPLVAQRRAGLRSLAGACLEHFYDPLARSAQFHGRLEQTDDGAVELRYDFDEEDEALDFERLHGYLARWREGLTIGSDEDSSSFAVRGGAFGGQGAVCYRHPLQLAQPVSARYGLEVGDVTVGSLYVQVLVGICDAGGENLVATTGLGGLFVQDAPEHHRQVAYVDEVTEWETGRVYEVEVRVEDGVATTWVDGTRIHELPAGPRTSGATILFSHSDAPVRFHWLELEGRLDPAEIKRLRDVWVEGELERLGL